MRRFFLFIFFPLVLFSEQRSDYPLLSVDTFLAVADHVVEVTLQRFDPLKVKPGDIVFVASPSVQMFLKKVLPKIQSNFVMITSNSCGTVTDRYLSYLEDPHLVAWFGMNITFSHPKIHPIPLGIPESRYPNYPEIVKRVEILKAIEQDLSLDLFFKPKPIHTYLNINTCSNCKRSVVRDYFAAQSYCKVEAIKPFHEYMEEVKNSRFVLSPRGANIDCYRTWETLYAGSIPVVESLGIDRVYEDLPVVIVEDLTAVTQEQLDEAFEALKDRAFKLEKLHADYWFNELKKAQESCLFP